MGKIRGIEKSLLTDEQEERALKWIAENCPVQRCPLCGTDQWVLQKNFVEIRPFNWGDFIVGGNLYPNVMLMCQKCGHVVLINALHSRVISDQELLARRAEVVNERGVDNAK